MNKRLPCHNYETEQRTIKIETEKINQVLTYILTKNITELNDLMNAGINL